MLVPVVLLGLARCASGLSGAEEDACRRIHAWDAGGREADSFDEAVASANDSLEDSDKEALVALGEELAALPEADRADGAAEFLALCSDLGWDLPEG